MIACSAWAKVCVVGTFKRASHHYSGGLHVPRGLPGRQQRRGAENGAAVGPGAVYAQRCSGGDAQAEQHGSVRGRGVSKGAGGEEGGAPSPRRRHGKRFGVFTFLVPDGLATLVCGFWRVKYDLFRVLPVRCANWSPPLDGGDTVSQVHAVRRVVQRCTRSNSFLALMLNLVVAI